MPQAIQLVTTRTSVVFSLELGIISIATELLIIHLYGNFYLTDEKILGNMRIAVSTLPRSVKKSASHLDIAMHICFLLSCSKNAATYGEFIRTGGMLF